VLFFADDLMVECCCMFSEFANLNLPVMMCINVVRKHNDSKGLQVSWWWCCCLCCPCTGLHYRLFKVPAASLKTPVPHGFAPQEGLANPFLMQQWMAGGTADAGSVG
jgi:hypothetical protein